MNRNIINLVVTTIFRLLNISGTLDQKDTTILNMVNNLISAIMP